MKIAKVRIPPSKLPKGLAAKSKRFVEVGYLKKQIMSEDDERAKGCFEIFETQAELDKKMKKKQNIWTHYEFKYPINPETQLRYESFFSGFLHYYDTELRNGMSDHTLYCHWNKKQKQDVVTVYLYPAPLRHPVKPSGKNPTIKTAGEFVDITNEKNKEMLATIYNIAWSPGVSGLQSDPPSPTGPPPPTP